MSIDYPIDDDDRCPDCKQLWKDCACDDWCEMCGEGHPCECDDELEDDDE